MVASPWGHGPLSPRCCFVVASSQLLHGNIETFFVGASPSCLWKDATSLVTQPLSGNIPPGHPQTEKMGEAAN